MKFWRWVVMHAIVILICALVGFALGMVLKGQYL